MRFLAGGSQWGVEDVKGRLDGELGKMQQCIAIWKASGAFVVGMACVSPLSSWVCFLGMCPGEP